MNSLICVAALVAGISCAQAQSLCVGGHPARRSPNVTYSGLPTKHGFQRDHVVPLELGGADVPGNVLYQRCDLTGSRGRCLAGPAALKDEDEHHAGGMFCAGLWTLDQARQWLAARWPVDDAHGY